VYMNARLFFYGGCLTCILGMVTLLGCGGTPKQDVVLTLNATQALNPDPEGTPHSVIVRVYTLKEQDRFNKATFDDLWKHDRDTLGSDLLAWKEITVHPDSQHPLELEVKLKKGEGFLGVVAFFREYQGKTWRQLLPLTDAPLIPFKAQKIAIVLDHHSLQVSQPQ